MRGAFFHVCEGRVGLGAGQPLAARDGVTYSSQPALGGRYFAVGVIKGLAETLDGGKELVLIPLRRHDAVTRSELLRLLPLCRLLPIENLDLVAELGIAGTCRLLVIGRQMLLVHIGQRIHQPRQEYPVGALSFKLHHLGAFDGPGNEHTLRTLHRVRSQALWKLP